MSNVIPFRRSSDLAQQAAASEILLRVAEFAQHVGAGTKLTATGCLSLADARVLAERFGCGDLIDPLYGKRQFKTKSSVEIVPVDMIFRWAHAAKFVRIAKGSLFVTPRGRGLGEDPLDDWIQAFDGFVDRMRWPEVRVGGWHAQRHWFLAELSDKIEWLLAQITSLTPQAVPVRLLAVMFSADLSPRVRWNLLPEPYSEWLGEDAMALILLEILAPLEQLGAVVLEGPGGGHSAHIDHTEQFAAKLTDLGTLVISRRL